jgi:hypothetical protein
MIGSHQSAERPERSEAEIAYPTAAERPERSPNPQGSQLQIARKTA